MRRARNALAGLVAFAAALGLPGAERAAEAPADPWPRQFKAGNATILVYQPQVESWTGNVLTFRSAIGIRKPDPKDDVFGVLVAKARTQVDKASRMVLLEDVAVIKRSFPTLPDNGLLYLISLKTQLGPSQRTVSLDRLEASLAASGAAAPPGVAVGNDPPRILVSETPAILVRTDGPPALRPLSRTAFQRVINTNALLLADANASAYYLRAGDGWLTAASLAGPWTRLAALPEGMEAAAKPFANARAADLLANPGASASPSLAGEPPAVFVSETPAVLLVFDGSPDFTPVTGTGLARAANTTASVLLDTESHRYYVLLSGRWFRADALSGPWTFVPSPELPADFRKIPADSPAASVLASVAGTPQAEAALVANAIPQTASVGRVGGPTFAPRFDGTPQTAPIAGTPLQYVVNSPTPIIQAAPKDFYALQAGVWFTSSALSSPWVIAATLPDTIAAIPPSSPLYFVTHVHIYGATIGFVHEGYTPGYLGSISTPDGVVVHGTGHVYPGWIGSAWYPSPATYASWGGPADPGGEDLYRGRSPGVSAEVRSAFSTVAGKIVTGNVKAGKTSPYGTVEADNDVYVDKDGQIYTNAGGSWRMHSASGWTEAPIDMAWADREAEARRAGEASFQGFSQAEAGPAGSAPRSGNSDQ